MAERDQQLPAGVPRLIDQYKQRRQAWLAQADELVRLRDEVRSAAEREALEIVTAARRDVRRIVVEARRNLLVLTAQLHATIESVDQASLQAATDTALGADAQSHAVTDALTGQRSLGATEDLVLGARREVRSVLDEARAEIEALVAEANGPLREIPAALGAPSPSEPPIPTLENILGVDPLAARHDTVSAPPNTVKGHDRDDRGGGESPATWLDSPDSRASASIGTDPFAGGPAANLALAVAQTASPVAFAGVGVATAAAAPAFATRDLEEALSFVVAPADSPHHFGGFHATEEPAVEPLSIFADSGPVQRMEPGRTFLADYDEATPSRPAWMWVGLFAATGIVAIVGTVWWFTLRDSGTALATSVAARTESSPSAAVTPVANTAPSGTASTTAPTSGLAIEVRRTAWIRTIVDGKEDSRVYQAGETRQIVGARAVSIRAGDGGAVFVSVDGGPVQALGAAGAPVTKQYALPGEPTPVPALATAPSSTASSVEPLSATPTAPLEARQEPQALSANPPARTPEVARTGTPAPTVPAPGATAAPPNSAPVPAPAEPASATPAAGGRADLIAAGQQWLDAYQRRDRDAMATSGIENMTISDERSVTERFPAWQGGVRRDLDQLELELSGDTALLTARMTERSGEAATTSAQHISRVSQIWVRRAGRWRLADVRIIAEARLNQIVR